MNAKENKIVVFGATGYTGQLVVDSLRQRNIAPLLAGRDTTKLQALSKKMGGLDYQVADVNDLKSVEALVEEGDVLLTTVGPFTIYGDAALKAARNKGAHYVDSTGEPAFIRKVVEKYHQAAQLEGLVFMTAAAYDYVPGNFAAALALDEAGPEAVRVDVGYFGLGDGKLSLSDGTKESIGQVMLEPALFWRNKRLVEGYGSQKLRHFTLRNKKHPAISIACSEHFFLPRDYPQLQEINTYLGWFGTSSYFMVPFARINAKLMKSKLIKQKLKELQSQLFSSTGNGPDQAVREESGSQVVAIAYDKNGRKRSEVVLQGPNGYTFTANILAWIADKVLHAQTKRPGAVGPVEAFGLQMLEQGCKEAGLERTR